MKVTIERHYEFSEEDVKILLNHFGSYRKMGKVLGYSGSYIHDLLHNRRKAPQSFIDRLSKHYRLRCLNITYDYKGVEL